MGYRLPAFLYSGVQHRYFFQFSQWLAVFQKQVFKMAWAVMCCKFISTDFYITPCYLSFSSTAAFIFIQQFVYRPFIRGCAFCRVDFILFFMVACCGIFDWKI
jgi:hypothetical protein